jgi:hypothetical protein
MMGCLGPDATEEFKWLQGCDFSIDICHSATSDNLLVREGSPPALPAHDPLKVRLSTKGRIAEDWE